LSAWWPATELPVLADGLGPGGALLAGEAICKLAWWASSGAIGERGAAG
jgi:hypothetical protein